MTITIQHPAVVAAAQASDAVSELLRYAREGEAMEGWPFGEAEPVKKLAEAIAVAGEIELDGMNVKAAAWQEDREMLGQLIAAARRFIEGWEG